ncbi:uncharacterized protein LOC123313078 [Coccinella septempunctata]|uniref:uncharacterized protein LOC123313078 n=1 Tax=Coccinella septempunctata TaxID=41139 RepID=UPI001D07D3C4|nr:uncharacterized protein LOC123313078 [Coccinella septempunctata]
MASNNLNVTFNNSILRHNHYPKYLGITLDRTPSFNKHLTNLAAKLRTRNNILYKLAGSTWGADASTLRTSALSLVFSTAEYCASVWLNSPYVSKVDTVLNQTMRIISGSVKSTPIEWLPVLCHIEPPKIRRQQILVREFKKVSENLDLPIHQDIIRFNRLKSRNPTVKTAQQLVTNNFNGYEEWIASWQSRADPAWHPLLDPKNPPQGFNLPRKIWVRLNRIRTGHGRSGSALFKWGMRMSPECDCGAASQTMHHIAYECPTRRFSGTTSDFLHATARSIQWLNQLDIEL